ncbi:MAG: response regulator transcription factor [Acidimicrobiaceae bacterium]|nr:response regulator transcription factor [Acidimicrobiaceae bacterium]
MGGDEGGDELAATVLVVEDELKLRELLRAYLERDGLAVLSAGTGAEALDIAAKAPPDLVVLDLGLPDIPGEEVARELRRGGSGGAGRNVPILILTAKADEEDRVKGLELGADDYVTKPFSPRELVLRVQAILRRSLSQPGQTGRRGEGERGDRMSFGEGELILDEGRREALVRGAPVDLTPTEWGILSALASRPGRVYSRYELLNRVRGYEYAGYDRTVDSHVKNLRRKIEADPRSPRLVLTVLGGGYRLAVRRDV